MALPGTGPVTSAATPTFGDNFTEVQRDRRVTFRLLAPQADAVSVLIGLKSAVNEPAGTTTTPMIKSAKGLWTVILGPFEPNLYEYLRKMPMNPPDVNSHFPGLHRRIALTFRRNPKMIRAFAYRLRSRFAKSADQMSKQHLEWYVILSLWSPMEVIKMLEDSSDRSTRLRRTSPLPFLLSEDDMSDYFGPLFAWPRFGI